MSLRNLHSRAKRLEEAACEELRHSEESLPVMPGEELIERHPDGPALRAELEQWAESFLQKCPDGDSEWDQQRKLSVALVADDRMREVLCRLTEIRAGLEL